MNGLSAVLSFFLLLLSVAAAQQEGWKMTDRFYGFRYEVTGHPGPDYPEYVQSGANELGCFGWVQHTPKDHFVGEVRCSKAQGPKMEEWLRHRTGFNYKTELLVYTDTKIRLHFSQFKILEESRDTCFLDKPHQCAQFDESQQQQRGNEEL